MDIRNMIENKRNSIEFDMHSKTPFENSVYVSESDITMLKIILMNVERNH